MDKYNYKASYLKWSIRMLGVLHWLFPRKLEVSIVENPQFKKDSPYFLTTKVWFRIEGRLFRVALPSPVHFDNIDEIPEAVLKAYQRAKWRVEAEKDNPKLRKEYDDGKRSHSW